jgi:hypothetical protein
VHENITITNLKQGLAGWILADKSSVKEDT